MLEKEKIKNGISGIYCIENKINNKKYIGQSQNIKTRWNSHIRKLDKNIHDNKYLQSSWNKYGKDNFKFYIIEKCKIEILDEREIYWIGKYDANNEKYGYNLTSGGGGYRDGVLSQETREYMSKIKNPEKVVQIDFDGKLVKIWRSATQAQRTLEGIRARSILQCCRHVIHQANGFIWFYKEEYDNIKNFDVKQYMFDNNRFFDIPILQYDLYGNLIKEWNLNELKNSGLKIHDIKRCCRHERITYNGYIWIYKYDRDFELTEEFLHRCQKSNNIYSIYQYDRDMNLIKKWSVDELKSNNEYNLYRITSLCNGKYKSNTYQGFIWSYKEVG